MSSPTYKEYRQKFDEKITEIEKLSNSYVLVGFQDGSITKAASKDGRKKMAGQSMAQIAAENEYGTSRIPARPFLRPSIDNNRDKINKLIGNEYDKIMLGNSTVDKSLGLIGTYAQNLIKRKIREIQHPPNARSTILRKKSSKPLIDFGQMIQSVTYKVVIP